MTKDGVIIVCHDDDFKRLCGVEKLVKDTNLADLPEFKKEMPMHFSRLNKDCEFQNYQRKDTDQKTYSTLEDVFKVIPKEVPISIEIKDQDIFEAGIKTVALIKKYDRYGTTITGSE